MTNKLFIPIDFSPTLSSGFELTPPKYGYIDVSVGFKNGSDHNITMIAYSNFNHFGKVCL